METSIGQYNYWADQFEALPLYFMSYFGSHNIQTVLEVNISKPSLSNLNCLYSLLGFLPAKVLWILTPKGKSLPRKAYQI